MPTAGDPTLLTQLPISHDPLQRVSFQGYKPKIDLEEIDKQIHLFITNYLFPFIEDLTGIDLSAFLPILDLLDLDFSGPTEFLLSLINVINNLPSVIGQLLVGIISQLNLTKGINLNSILELITGINGAGAIVALVENVIDTADDTVQDWINGFFAAFTGMTGIGLPSSSVSNAQTSQTNVIAAIAASVAKIEAQLAILEASDNFERVTSSGMGPNWQITPYGTGGISNPNIFLDGHQVVMTASTFGGTAGYRCRWIGTNDICTTDNMKMQIVLGTPLTPTATDRPFIEMRCRENSTSTTATIARLYADNLVLVAQNSLTETVIGSPVVFSSQPGVGSNVTFECGIDGVGDRQHRVTINNTVHAFNDSANVGAVGTSFRGRGFGMFAGNNLFVIQVAPGAIAHWAVEDIDSSSGPPLGIAFPYTLPVLFT